VSNHVLQILASNLSDGAKIAAIAAAVSGAKSAREIATLTRRKLRTVERHYAELRTSEEYADLRSCEYADLRVPPETKRKIPHTPFKKKLNPSPQTPPGKLEENKTTVRASCTRPAAADSEESRQTATELAEILNLTVEQAGKVLNAQLRAHPCWLIKVAVARMAVRIESGEKFSKPAVIFSRICEDVKRDQPVVQRSGIDLGNGRFLSRWG
jgi:hypothetical protein